MDTLKDYENKFNNIIPEWSSDKAICILLDKPITRFGYESNFLPKVQDMLEKNNAIRLGLYMEDYQGFEKDAAALDMATWSTYGPHTEKLALINPPESFIFKVKMKAPLIKGEIRYYNRHEKDEALAWLNED